MSSSGGPRRPSRWERPCWCDGATGPCCCCATRWGLPGGLLKRDEHPSDAALREVSEEVGVEAEITGPPRVVFDPKYRRVDVVFPARLADENEDQPYPRSIEITEVGWFAPDDFPRSLQRETVQALVEAEVLSEPAPRHRKSSWTMGSD